MNTPNEPRSAEMIALKADCHRALNCLYLAAEESAVMDATSKIMAYINALERSAEKPPSDAAGKLADCIEWFLQEWDKGEGQLLTHLPTYMRPRIEKARALLKSHRISLAEKGSAETQPTPADTGPATGKTPEAKQLDRPQMHPDQPASESINAAQPAPSSDAEGTSLSLAVAIEALEKAETILNTISLMGEIYEYPNDWDHAGMGRKPELRECDTTDLASLVHDETMVVGEALAKLRAAVAGNK